MNTSSAHVDPEVDEFALSGLTPAPSIFNPPAAPCILGHDIGVEDSKQQSDGF